MINMYVEIIMLLVLRKDLACVISKMNEVKKAKCMFTKFALL